MLGLLHNVKVYSKTRETNQCLMMISDLNAGELHFVMQKEKKQLLVIQVPHSDLKITYFCEKQEYFLTHMASNISLYPLQIVFFLVSIL